MEIPSHLVNHHYDDRYFDVVSAIKEAKQIFFQGNNLKERLLASTDNPKQFMIGETGFGAGRVFVALIDFLDTIGVTNVDITYNSVELHPLTHQRMALILEEFREEAGPLIDLLVEAYSHIEITKTGWHQLHLLRPFGTLTLNLWVGEALEMINALHNPCDAWFLDGHGPRKNPAMWRIELLKAIGEKTKPFGTCATYTVAGAVRRGLTVAGFSIEKAPGCGGKKETIRGVKV